jgi:acyl-CoA synthetase (AMP-forming)/AMP-acid ligase II
MLSAGKPHLTMRVRVVADNRDDVPSDGLTPGEIWLKGDAVSSGYWAMPDETANSWEDGWFKTGDIAVIDGDGFVTIVDRKKDIIITGGINVFSREVEEELYLHPAVREVAVVGIADPVWGEAIHAEVVLAPRAEITEQELINFVGQRLAGYKKPRSIRFVESLPMTATGKVLKREVRARYTKPAQQ